MTSCIDEIISYSVSGPRARKHEGLTLRGPNETKPFDIGIRFEHVNGMRSAHVHTAHTQCFQERIVAKWWELARRTLHFRRGRISGAIN
jgi:hypothetical protein